jgi:hypothetical protein
VDGRNIKREDALRAFGHDERRTVFAAASHLNDYSSKLNFEEAPGI